MGLEAVGNSVGELVLALWQEVLEGLTSNPESVGHLVDWVAKKRLVQGYAERHQLRSDDARLKAIDLQYHDMRAERCLAHRVGLARIVDPVDVQLAMTTPPDDTRAYFRGRCIAKWPSAIASANWDSIMFDTGRDPLQRVPMMEPHRGTAALVGPLIDRSDTPLDLLRALEAHD